MKTTDRKIKGFWDFLRGVFERNTVEVNNWSDAKNKKIGVVGGKKRKLETVHKIVSDIIQILKKK